MSGNAKNGIKRTARERGRSDPQRRLLEPGGTRAGKISLQHELWNQRDRIGARSRRSCDLHEAVSAGAVWLQKQAKTAQLPLRLPVQELHRQFRRLSPL